MKNIIYLYALLILTSCTSKMADNHTATHEHAHDEEHAHEEHNDEEVHLTTKQIKTIGLELGKFSKIKVSNYLKANGVLDLPPSSIASVNAVAEGFVKTTQEYLVGSYVKKGAILLTLEHPSYIQKQQEYLEITSELVWLNQELQRQKKLSEANTNALKAYQKAQSDYQVKTAQRKGIALYLKYLGINTADLENGKMMQSIVVTAPITGYVTAVNVHKGMLVKPETELYEIVDNHHIHLELDVFENDVAKIKEGQSISFMMPAFGKEIFEAEVHLIGKSFNQTNKTVRVHGHIKGNHPAFIRGLYAEAKIWQNDKMANALPEEAIVLENGQHYIFVKDGHHNDEIAFRRIPVKVGEKEEGYIVVKPLEEITEQKDIVTKEAFFLYAQMNKGEHAHEH